MPTDHHFVTCQHRFAGRFLSGGGFTLVELIVVLIVAGILAAVTLPKFSGSHGFEDRAYRDEILAALRYAQKSAVAARRRVCVDFSSTTEVRFRIAAAYGDPVCSTGLSGPDGANPWVVAASGGAALATLPAAFSFAPSGIPSAGVIMSFSGGVPALTVETGTGYVH